MSDLSADCGFDVAKVRVDAPITAVHVVIGWNDDYESAYLYEAPPGSVDGDDRSFEADVPVDLWRRHDEAVKVERAAFDAIVEATGFDTKEARMAECCPAWVGTESPGHTFYEIVLAASGSEDEWPICDVGITSRRSLDEAQTVIDALPERFHLFQGHQLVEVDRSRFSVNEKGWGPTVSGCHRCGWSKSEHRAGVVDR